ncbi:MAG: acetylornithine deacetylase/succinyl-diaminopimelate desuccinylase-like protein [Lysobacterales bacterium]|jgi:acetylornithine deacetylase/succinyl-diaminopimelate desuccinylase-like protein
MADEKHMIRLPFGWNGRSNDHRACQDGMKKRILHLEVCNRCYLQGKKLLTFARSHAYETLFAIVISYRLSRKSKIVQLLWGPEMPKFKKRPILVLFILFLLVCSPLLAQESPFSELTKDEQLSEDILREMVSFESSIDQPEQIEAALRAIETILHNAGFASDDVKVLNPLPDSYGLVIRFRGLGEKKPLLVLAHIDVVPAVPSQWEFPPFVLGKKDGFYIGRGTSDNKAGASTIISNFIRLKREGWTPSRDVIAAISGNEETSGDFANWLANEGRHLVDAEFAINTDAGGGEYDEKSKPLAFWVQTSEKIYQTYELKTSNKGGHSSVPRPDNAIRDLALAITKLTDHRFPVKLNRMTKLTFRRSAVLHPDDVAKDMLELADGNTDEDLVQRLSESDPYFNALLRTTCVPTLLSGGHAENALPREASVIVNCRIQPGTKPKEIESVIAGLVDGLGVEIGIQWDGLASDVSDLPDPLLEQLESLVESRFGNIPVIPAMSTGATDGLYFRNAGMPVFGVSGLFGLPGGSGAHGLNEKVGINEFHQSVDFMYDLLKMLAD